MCRASHVCDGPLSPSPFFFALSFLSLLLSPSGLPFFSLSMEEAVALLERLAWESPVFSVCKEILTLGFILSDF